MTPYQLLRVIWARRMIVLAGLFALGAIALGLSLVVRPTWTATAELIIDLKAVDPVLGTRPDPAALAGYVSTQVDVIASERVARRVVEKLQLAKQPEWQTRWNEHAEGRGDLSNWIATQLLKKLDVRPARDSNIVRVSYKAADAPTGARLANAFADAYLETALSLRVDPARQNNEFFEARVRSAREDFERAQLRLSDFQRDNDFVSVDEKYDVENARLNELSSQLVTVQALLFESRSRAAVAAQRGENMQDVLDSRLVQQLKGDLAKADVRLKELGVQLGTEHPQYRTQQAEVEVLRQRLDSEVRRYQSSVDLAGSVNARREQQIRASLEEQRAKVLRLKAMRDRAAVLQRDVESAQRSYELVAQRQALTSIESQSRQNNVALLTPAVEPTDPSSPKIVLNTAVGLLFGGLLGIAAALVVESRNRRTRSVDDLTQAFQLPVLVVVPSADSNRRISVLPRASHVALRPPA